MLTRFLFATFMAVLVVASTRPAPAGTQCFTLLPGERLWGGNISSADKMPYGPGTQVDLRCENAGNQQQAMLVSNQGFYVYSENPFKFTIEENELTVEGGGPFHAGRTEEQNLRGAYRVLAKEMHAFNGEIPDEIMFTQPQWNTWIEYGTAQTADGLLRYVQAVKDNTFPGCLVMVDDKWQTEYGDYDFDPAKFPDPRKTMDQVHALGFKVMLWVVPFVHETAESYPFLKDQGYLLRSSKTGGVHFIKWWNGSAALLDLTNPGCNEWFVTQLTTLQDQYGVDGFKLDGGDMRFYNDPAIIAHDPDAGPHGHSQAFAKVGLNFSLNEYRACYGLGGAPLAQRLRDKKHDWPSLRLLIPGMTAEGIWGYPYCCPDMIGGGEINSLSPETPKNQIDGELVVRGAQIHALMPMMQFSVAPWRILSPRELDATRAAAQLHVQFGPKFVELAHAASKSGEPIVRALEYNYPHQGYLEVQDEFMIGEDVLVAPVVEQGVTQRQVLLPPGTWKADDGSVHQGPPAITVEAPLERLPYFVRQ